MAQKIRLAAPADSAAILNVYSPFITDTAITFETEVPSLESFTKRVEKICARYPFLVVEQGGKIEGYAYASTYKERSAYRFDVELSVYLSEKAQGTGAAKALYEKLFALLKALGYVNAYSICTVPNEKSLRFHEKEGFALMCTHRKTGYKFGRWWDVAWFEKTIREHADSPEEPLSICDLPVARVEEILL